MARNTPLPTYSLYLLCLTATALALLVPDWKRPLMAEGYYTNTPVISSISVSDGSFGLWGDDIAPEPDCYGSIGNCPGKSFIDNSAWSIPNGKSEWNSNTATASFTASSFDTHYTNELRSQAQLSINTALYYKPRFNVAVSISGEGEWDLEVDVSRVAAINIRERDSGSDNRIDVSGLSTSLAGAGLASGSLALPSLPRYSTQGTYPVSQTNKAFIHGTGPATLTFAMVYDINTRIHGATLGTSDSVCWMSGQSNQGAAIDCNPSPNAQQGLWLKGILHVNSAPVSQADAYEVDTSGVFTLGSVLANDSDADGDNLSVLGIDTSHTHGTLINNGDGSFDYDARTAYGYLDSTQTATTQFFYRASDGSATGELTPVTITIHGTRPVILPLDGIFKGSSIQEDSGPQ